MTETTQVEDSFFPYYDEPEQEENDNAIEIEIDDESR